MQYSFKIIVFCIISMWGIQQAYAKAIPFSIDAAQFRYDSTSTLWEMYYSFPDTSLIYTKTSKGYLGELYIRTIIFSASDTIAAQQWIVTNQRDTISSVDIKNLIGQKMFVLKPGQYTIDIYIYDINDTTSQARVQFPVLIKKFNTKIGISDIEIATSISNDKNGLPAFKKGQLTVIPNASLEYTGTDPELRIYSEIYNTSSVSSTGFKIQYTILDALKNEVFSVPFVRFASGEAIVETISLPMSIVPSGIYFVHSTVYAPAENPTDSFSVSKKFYIINPDMPPDIGGVASEDDSFERSIFSTLIPEQIKTEFEQLSFIATRQEIDSYNSLSEHTARQKFIYRFWVIHDSDPSTIINETLEEYRKNIIYANTYYANIQQKEGWKTDRGRVLLKYGKPSEIDKKDYNIEGRPYEVWTYNNTQGGVTFAFVDMSGYNNYRLVHSTAIGETRNDKWMERFVQIQNLNPEGGR